MNTHINDHNNHNNHTSLPPNFLQRVVELQTQLQCEGSSQGVTQQLNDLYVVAMDYYIQHDLRKLQHFHRKLTSLLTRTSSFKNLQNKPKIESKQQNSYIRSLKSQMTKFNIEGMILVQSMLQGSEIKANSSKRAMIENIQSQQAVLKNRMMQRGKSKSTAVPASLR